MPHLHAYVQAELRARPSHANPHGRTAPQVHRLPIEFHAQRRPQNPHAFAHGRAAVQMHPVPEELLGPECSTHPPPRSQPNPIAQVQAVHVHERAEQQLDQTHAQSASDGARRLSNVRRQPLKGQS